MPCRTADGGAALASIAYRLPDEWLIDCYDTEQSSQAQSTQHHLYGTANAGASWARLGDPTNNGQPTLLEANGAGDAVLTTESGSGDWLDATSDNGRNWTTRFRSGGHFGGWADLQFLDSATGFIVGPTHNAPEHLYRTDDSGKTWLAITIKG